MLRAQRIFTYRMSAESVFIVADLLIYREGLATIIAREPDLGVLGHSGSWEQALAELAPPGPPVLILDMAVADAVRGVRVISESLPRTAVVAFAVPDHDDDIVALAEAGVAGYITRDESIAGMLEAIHAVTRGEAACSPRTAAALLRHVGAMASPHATGDDAAPLTAREREIVALIDEGLSNKQIASRLCIQLSTVKNHVHHVLEKMDVARRGEAAARLRGMGRSRLERV